MAQGTPVGDLDAAAGALAGWLLENIGYDDADARTCHDALCELPHDIWKEAAEVAIRAARGERDHRPFTMCPSLPR